MPPNASPAPAATLKRNAMASSDTSRSPVAKKPRKDDQPPIVAGLQLDKDALSRIILQYEVVSAMHFPDVSHKSLKEGLVRIMGSMKGNLLPYVVYGTRGNGARLYPANPYFQVQNMPSIVSNTLLRDFMHDIDIVNSEPTTMEQWCAGHGFGTPGMTHYVNHRDECLLELGEDRDEAKDMVNRAINCGGVPKDAPEWLRRMRQESGKIAAWVKENRPDIWATAEKNNKAKKEKKQKEGLEFRGSIEGAAVALLYHELEVQFLRIMVRVLKAHGRLTVPGIAGIIALLSHDGIKTPRLHEGPFPEHVLREIEAAILEETGYRHALLDKPMKKFIEFEEQSEDAEVVVTDGENEASLVFLRKIEGKVLQCNGVVWVHKDGIWTSKEKVVRAWLLDRCTKANIYTIDKKGNKCSMSNGASGAERIIRIAMTRVPDVPDFLELVRESTRGKLLFLDGYWDFAQRCFVAGFKGVYGIVRINRPFPCMDDEMKQAATKELKEKVIYPVWGRSNTDKGDDWEALRLFLARALAGHVEDKQWGIGQGRRNSGKGVLTQLLEDTFGGYVGTVPCNNFLARGDWGGDESKKMSWIDICQYVRLVVTSEMRVTTGGKASVIDGDVLKMLCNGGSDTIMIRRNNVDEYPIKIACAFLLMVNDVPDIKPADAYETMLAFPFGRKFIARAVFEKEYGQGGSSGIYSIADDTIKSRFCKRPEIIDAFLLLILDGYRGDAKVTPTERMIAAKGDLETESADDKLRSFFEFTGSVEQYEDINVIKQKLEEHKIGIQYPAFKLKADELNASMDVTNEAKRKIVNGRYATVLYGVRYIRPESSGPASTDSGYGRWVGPTTAAEARGLE
jgi:hypothetical protein